MESYNRMNVLTLKNLARERGLRGYSTLRKAELIEQLINPPPPEYTRAQLIQLARERGLRGYSRLRKSQLLQRLGASRGQILDQEIDARMVNVPFLTPTQYTHPQATPAPSLNAVEDLIDYLDNVREIPKSVSSRVKKLQEEIKSKCNRMKLFDVRESKSALRKFAKAYTINGIEEYDARSFLQNARKNITSVLRDNRKTKVK